MNKSIFKSPAGDQLTATEVVKEIIKFMQAEPGEPRFLFRKTPLQSHYKIIIGTDSESLADGQADFVTAIVVHRVGNGGRYFWRRATIGKVATLRDRIWQEVTTSLEVAKGFLSLIEHFPIPRFDFEIHVDVGENGKTSPMIQELVATIRANNFEAKTKPNSYAASKVADRHNCRYALTNQ